MNYLIMSTALNYYRNSLTCSIIKKWFNVKTKAKFSDSFKHLLSLKINVEHHGSEIAECNSEIFIENGIEKMVRKRKCL